MEPIYADRFNKPFGLEGLGFPSNFEVEGKDSLLRQDRRVVLYLVVKLFIVISMVKGPLSYADRLPLQYPKDRRLHSD